MAGWEMDRRDMSMNCASGNRIVTPKRIALYGGTFDPLHLGHLLVARAAMEEMQLEKVYFIPTAQSPFKPDQLPTPPQTRLQMLRIGLAGNPDYEVDEQEIERGGISYTIDTVRDYQKRFGESHLSFVIGADHVPSLPKWRDAGELASSLHFIVIPRPGENDVVFPTGYKGVVLRGFPLGVSSSQIRQRVRDKLTVRHLVPNAVEQAIVYNGLYL
ncbi:MAG: nicotinate (nicotinamide) nucleotide adenylyltransferase [Verrucomicrobiales bacterium]|nr:nicotinate (nicotinamide) nucleotide adenylyltransferase [Verrucomicrobiales bacterium]MDB6129310.1 nicotinate (nicotinamide) nucleotide adenylyltransferase [Verrucomicrobiales bacterium]